MQRPRAFGLLGTRLETGRIVLYGLGVGVLAGLAGTLFATLLDASTNWLLLDLTGYHPPGLASEGGVLHAFPGERRYILPILLGLALLVARWLPARGGAASSGDGVNAALNAYHNGRARFDPREVASRAFAGLVALAAGAPLGREGPITALTSGLGALFGHWGRLSEEDRRLVFVAGLAAGLGLVLRAPLAGAVLAVEVLYRRFEFEFEALTSAVLAAVVAYAIYGLARGFAPLFEVPTLAGQPPGALPAFFLLGLIEALASSGLVAGIAALRGAWRSLHAPLWLPLALTGAVVGAIGIAAPGILGDGLGWTQLSLSGFLPQADLVSQLFWRALAVLLLASAGAAGGLITPSLVLGGLIGSLFALGLDALFPAAAFDPAAFTLTGMAAFLAGAVNAPLGATLLVTEWSGYGLLVPLLLTTASAYALIGRRSVLDAQPESRSSSPVHIAAYVTGAVQLVASAQPEPGLKLDLPALTPSSAGRWGFLRPPARRKPLIGPEPPKAPLNVTNPVPDLLDLLAGESLSVSDTASERLYRLPLPAAWVGQAVRDLEWPPEALLVAILRDQQVRVPRGATTLELGDDLIIMAEPGTYARMASPGVTNESDTVAHSSLVAEDPAGLQNEGSSAEVDSADEHQQTAARGT